METKDKDFYIRLYPFAVQLQSRIEYGYGENAKKQALRDALSSASRGYCYYCYNRIFFDGRHYGQVEHSIEKGNVINAHIYNDEKAVSKKSKLANCIHNLSLACPNCNGSLKRVHENERLICPQKNSSAKQKQIIKDFEEEVIASGFDCSHCTNMCDAFIKLRNIAYEKMRRTPSGSNILLQPDSIPGENSQPLILYYDLVHFCFCVPPEDDPNNPCTKEEQKFITNHIKQFALNDPLLETKELIRFLKDTIEQEGTYSRNYQNYIVQTFIDQKLVGKSKEEIKQYCEKLFLLAVMDRRDL